MNKLEQACLDGFIKAANVFGIDPKQLEALSSIGKAAPEAAEAMAAAGKVAPEVAGAAKLNPTAFDSELDMLRQKYMGQPAKFHTPMSINNDFWASDPESDWSSQGGEVEKALSRLRNIKKPWGGFKDEAGQMVSSIRKDINKIPDAFKKKPVRAGVIGAGAGLGGYELANQGGTALGNVSSQNQNILKNPINTALQSDKYKKQLAEPLSNTYHMLMDHIQKHPYEWGGGAAAAAGLGGLGYYLHGHKKIQPDQPALMPDQPGEPEEIQ